LFYNEIVSNFVVALGKKQKLFLAPAVWYHKATVHNDSNMWRQLHNIIILQFV